MEGSSFDHYCGNRPAIVSMGLPLPSRNFEQNSPITTILRQICEAYPESSCLRELLQNADDAQASEIEYILDTSTYHEEPLIDDGLKAYHGPALLVKNNSVFEDDDFASLASIGDSRKRIDPASTGKYGQGFNSCYHWTDGPWILSRQWLLFLDPHREWSKERGGPTYDFVECQDSPEMQNHLKTFKPATVDTSRAVDATVIRIPLRTKAQAAKSKIVNREISTEEITKALHELGQEIKEGGMLFLRHVRKVTAKVNDTVLWQAHATGATDDDSQAMQSISGAFRDMYTSVPGKGDLGNLSRGFVVNVQYVTQSSSSTHSFFVQHMMTAPPTIAIQSTKTTKSTSETLGEWACKKKLFPWVAIAAPLYLSQDDAPRGRLFSCLRMPIETSQPVHIHGLFAIVPDRSRLSSSDTDSEWNQFMFRECVSEAWTKLLCSRSSYSWKDECFRLWPHISTSESREVWSCLDDLILDQIITKNFSVWNTHNGCVPLRDGFFAPDGEDVQVYGDAFKSLSLPLICLESCTYDKVLLRAAKMNKQVPLLSPHALRKFLRDNKRHEIPRSWSSLLLQYCLLDFIQNAATIFGTNTKIRQELKDISLWPTMQNTLAALDDTAFLLPRGEEESLLFQASRQPHTLDLHCLTPPVVELLRRCAKDFFSFVRQRVISDLGIDWEAVYPLPSTSASVNICSRKSQEDQTIQDIWSWICARCKEEGESWIISKKNLNNLFLVPVNGSRIRRFAPDDAQRLTLIAENDNWIRGLMDHKPKENSQKLEFILDNACLPAKAVKLLITVAKKRPDTAFAIPDDLKSLLTWLVANKDILEEQSFQQKEMLVRHLRLLTEQKATSMQGTGKALLRQLLSQLPIFNQVFALAPYKERMSRSTAIDSPSRAIQVISSIPPIPTIPGLTFYRPLGSHEQYLVDFYDLLDKVSYDELIFEHLLPFFKERNDPTLAEVKLGLVNFALENTSHPSDSWKARFCTLDLIPKASCPNICGLHFRPLSDTVDPTSPLSGLFFEDEDVFPEPGFFKRHRLMLVSCGIIRDLTPEVVMKRVQAFAGSQKDIEEVSSKVKRMLDSSLPADFTLPPASLKELRNLKWLPASGSSFDGFRLMLPGECRASDESDLVDNVLGIVKTNVKPEWKELLGWDKDIDQTVLIQQLRHSLVSQASDRIDQILTYLRRFGNCQFLQQIPCLLSRRGEYVLAERLLLPGSLLSRYSLSPYLDEMEPSFAKKHSALLTALNVRQEVGDEDVLLVQDDLRTVAQSGPLSDEDLDVAIALLEITTHSGSDTKVLTSVLIPDTEKRLRARVDVVCGDRNVAGKIASFNFVHPRLSPYLIQRLDIEKSIARAIRLEIDFEDEDEDEYTPREKLSTIISDTLSRYPIESTFGEFLANANDCGATEISWVLDECVGGSYESSTLLDEGLKCLQGPALFVFNDGVFSDKDFEGFKNIGHGGKIDDETSTGMFGRGAMTMYHFTDVPMLISGSSFLILDPQQQCLPRNRHGQHKAGMKIPLETARRLFPDQLQPFDGLHGYSIKDDSYDGTLYRLPLRSSEETLLKDSSAKVDTKALLQDYFLTAQMSLLFLRNVSAISFGVRGLPTSWSVKSERSNNSLEEIFERVSVQSKHQPDIDCKTIWRVGMTDIEEAPDTIGNPGRRANKITECGLAACEEVIGNLPGRKAQLKQEKPKQRMFCTLPTLSTSDLPVSIHASFAITGDRKTIPFESYEKESAIKSWNRWLLTKCIPEFYIDFLKDLAPKLGEKAFDYWPSSTIATPVDSFGKIVTEAFYSQLASKEYDTYQLYPLIDTHGSIEKLTPLKSRAGGKARKLSRVASLKSAQFDVLPNPVSDALRPLFTKICANLVDAPPALWRHMREANIHHQAMVLDAKYICTLFQEESNCVILQDFVQSFKDSKRQDEVTEMLLRVAVPNTSLETSEPIEIVNNCRIVPKLDQTFGTVRFREKDSAAFSSQDLLFLPDDTEAKLFSNYASSLVKFSLFRGVVSSSTTLSKTIETQLKALRNPLHDMMTENSNIRAIGVADTHFFLPHVASSSKPLQKLGPSHNWTLQLWSYMKPKLETYSAAEGSDLHLGDLLKRLKLYDTPIYRYLDIFDWRYITPEQLKEGPYIVPPANEKQLELCNLLNGVKVLDPQCIPLQLQRTYSDLNSPIAFRRLLLVLAGYAKGASFKLFREGASREIYQILRGLIRAFVKADEKIDSDKREILRLLPVWPRNYYTPEQLYISAGSALVCPHKAMLQPWISSKDRFIDPDMAQYYVTTLEALGCATMTVQSTWEYLKASLPRELKPGQLTGYLDFIRCLALHSWRPGLEIAPNTLGVLCKPSSLFDHEDAHFQAAFRELEHPPFLHPLFRTKILTKVPEQKKGSKECDYWKSLGLRSKSENGQMGASEFLSCINQIVARFSSSPIKAEVYQDAAVITGYLCFFRPEFRTWSTEAWLTIAQAKIYRADSRVSSEPSYRRARMLLLANGPTPPCIDSSASTAHKRIMWSQHPFLKDPPDSAVYSRLPNEGRPKARLVYDHLNFLIEMRNSVGDSDLPEYLKDVQASYAYLQEQRAMTISIPNIREAKIWLNLHTTDLASITKLQFDDSLKSAKQLCFNAPLDTHMMERAKNFLVPYETLLKALGCQSMVQPAKQTTAIHGNKQRPIDRIWATLRDMRKKGQLVDVTFEAEGKQVSANRNIMAAVSGYCRTQFLGGWGNIHDAKVPIEIEGLSFTTLNHLVDFAYTGEINWPRLQDREDIDAVADALEELLEILQGADMWFMDMAHELTERYLLDNCETFIRPDNVDSVKELSEAARATRLVRHCSEFIRVNARFVQDCRDMK